MLGVALDAARAVHEGKKMFAQGFTETDPAAMKRLALCPIQFQL